MHTVHIAVQSVHMYYNAWKCTIFLTQLTNKNFKRSILYMYCLFLNNIFDSQADPFREPTVFFYYQNSRSMQLFLEIKMAYKKNNIL